ncbi:MAG: phosphoribosylamine--glycine ligase [Verrucomicrobia bacterium]|jgi:phosphoribosylamine---glycine ligase|nr:phosphoribosylamine--glycine ligase [Verrucomicrobiota bacterium]
MKVLVVGGGGREHALAWKLSNDSCKPDVFCAPGNAGSSSCATNVDIGAEDLSGLMAWARENRPDLTVVGPEVPLCEGLTDLLEAEGLRVFGPSKAAAQMEGSKIFAKDVMNAAGVPNAKSASFTDAAEAKAYIRSEGAPIVVKAEGLAAGKGVTVCTSVEQAEAAIDEALVAGAFGAAGDCVLVEECLIGEEASILAMIDGEHVVMLASSQDHKRALDHDEGPNTGGMGAYSPAPVVTDELWPFIREEVFGRTLAELKRRGITFKGILYAGLMMTEAGPKVLEFNVRFGDPETQVILPRIAGDLLPAFEACVDGTLSDSLIQWRDEHCVTIVMASGGYPGSYEKGKAITGLAAADGMAGVTVFHAGTAHEGESVVTSGGRVLAVTAVGSDLRSAVELAYTAVPEIRFEGAHYRSDIAARAL